MPIFQRQNPVLSFKVTTLNHQPPPSGGAGFPHSRAQGWQSGWKAGLSAECAEDVLHSKQFLHLLCVLIWGELFGVKGCS